MNELPAKLADIIPSIKIFVQKFYYIKKTINCLIPLPNIILISIWAHKNIKNHFTKLLSTKYLVISFKKIYWNF